MCALISYIFYGPYIIAVWLPPTIKIYTVNIFNNSTYYSNILVLSLNVSTSFRYVKGKNKIKNQFIFPALREPELVLCSFMENKKIQSGEGMFDHPFKWFRW